MMNKRQTTPTEWVTKVTIVIVAWLMLGVPSCYAQELTQQQQQAIQRRVKNKVEEFQFYLEQLADRQVTNQKMRNEAYQLALKLFIGHGEQYREYNVEDGAYVIKGPVKMQTSSKKNSRISNIPIKRYLQNLKNNSSYSNVVIQSADAVYVTDIVRAGDHYECVAYFCQKYIAYREGRVVYSDVTTKKIRIRIEKIEIPSSNGTTKVIWNALLGDIYVVETK
jgi:hypothetical protein